MKSSRGSTFLQGGLLALILLGLGYWVWQRYHHPAAPTYDGKALDQWLADLIDPDYPTSQHAADILAQAGGEAVSMLIDACEQGDIRLHRRAAAVLVRIGAPAAPALTATLKTKPKETWSEIVLVRLGPLAVPALREALADKEGGEAAVHVLGLMGPRAADALHDLIAVLQRRQAPVAMRGEAAFALGRIGQPSADIVPALIAALRDNKREVREQAAEALGWIGSPAREAVPALIAALKDDEWQVVKKACQALAFIDDATAAAVLLETFQSDRAEVVAAAGQALWRLGPKAQSILPALFALARGPIEKTAAARNLLASFGPPAVPVLMNALGDEETARREAAAELLGRIGPPARAAVPSLLAALKDKSPTVSLIAAMAVAEIDSTRAGAAVPLLADSLDTLGAAQALANIGPDARAAVPALIAALKPRKNADNADVLRRGAALALARIGTPAVPALIEALKDQRTGAAPLAAEALALVHPRPTAAVPALRAAFPRDHPPIEAGIALALLDRQYAGQIVPVLIAELKSADRQRQIAAISALGQLGPSAWEATPALLTVVRQMGEGAAEAVKQVLAGIGPKAIPALVPLLRDRDERFRRFAVSALAAYGPSAKEVLPSLLPLLRDPDEMVQVEAAHVLEGIGSDAAAALPILMANLQTPRTPLRYQAAVTLGHIGPAAKKARRPLLECLLDPDENVRYAAALSLGRIDPHFTEAAPALRDALTDAAAMVRLAAIDSLSRIDAAARAESVPILVALSGKPYPLDVRFRAVEGLHQLAAEEAKQAVPWLSVELTDVNPASCLYAARLLAPLDPSQTLGIVLALAAALRSPFADRRAILQTLAEFGPKAREAVPVIERLLQDGAPAVREEAMRTLRAIQPARAKQLSGG